jgi:hypothetical protein
LYFADELDRERLNIIRRVGLPMMPLETDMAYAAAASQTQRRHAMELHSKALAAMHDLELWLGIMRSVGHWRLDSDEWVAAAKLVESRRYQRAIDELEGLVVARMFELSKVNMSDTGTLRASLGLFYTN